jgi:hypothetical protein
MWANGHEVDAGLQGLDLLIHRYAAHESGRHAELGEIGAESFAGEPGGMRIEAAAEEEVWRHLPACVKRSRILAGMSRRKRAKLIGCGLRGGVRSIFRKRNIP